MNKKKFALLTTLLLPFGVSASSSSPCTVSVVLHPTIVGQYTTVDISYTDTAKLSFTFYYYFYITKNNVQTLVWSSNKSYTFNQGGNPTLSWSYQIPTYYGSSWAAIDGQAVTYRFQYKRSGTTYLVGDLNTYAKNPTAIVGGVDDGKMYIYRYVWKGSTSSGYSSGKDAYVFSGCGATKTSGNRCFGIADYQIEMISTFRNTPYPTTAYLRILDHLDEFVDAGDLVGSLSNGYVEFPIKVSSIAVDYSSYSYTYAFTLKNTYYVSLNNLYMTSVSHEGEEGWASTNSEIYIPVGYGHDADSYNAMIILDDWGDCLDSFHFTRKATFDESYFGNCSSATYCVIGS